MSTATIHAKSSKKHKGLLTRNVSVITHRFCLALCQLSPILSVIHTVTIGTMLNNNGMNDRHGLTNVTCTDLYWVHPLTLKRHTEKLNTYFPE